PEPDRDAVPVSVGAADSVPSPERLTVVPRVTPETDSVPSPDSEAVPASCGLAVRLPVPDRLAVAAGCGEAGRRPGPGRGALPAVDGMACRTRTQSESPDAFADVRVYVDPVVAATVITGFDGSTQVAE